jgi:TetR/AcrR family transcriptional regulator, transcriptional repressor for nem operon
LITAFCFDQRLNKVAALGLILVVALSGMLVPLRSSMPRAKEFDESEVLDKAIELFRRDGFQTASFSTLTAELGVSRQSLYDTYGDKHAFFAAALKRYRDRGLSQVQRLLDEPGPIRQQLLQLFEGTIGSCCGHGCLLVNSIIEQAPHDADTRALVQGHVMALQEMITRRVLRAQKEGEVAKNKDPVAIARFVYHTLLGLATGARGASSKEALVESARLALCVLD